MSDKEKSFVEALTASIAGQRANPSLDFRTNHSPVNIALRDAELVVEAVEARFPKVIDRHTPVEKEQKEFAKRFEQQNGKVER